MLRFLPLLLLAGCWFEDDDEYVPSVCGDGRVDYDEECDYANAADADSCSATCERVAPYTVHWRTKTVAGAEHSCPMGFDRANVIVQPVIRDGETFTPNGAPIVTTTPCADGSEVIKLEPIPSYSANAYRVAVSFASSTSEEVYGETLSTWLEEVTDVVMYEDAGFVRLGWNFHSAEWGTLDCFNANVADVTINITALNWPAASYTVPCMELATYSPPIPVGVWQVELVTSRATTTLTDVSVGRRSTVTDLGTVTLEIP